MESCLKWLGFHANQQRPKHWAANHSAGKDQGQNLTHAFHSTTTKKYARFYALVENYKELTKEEREINVFIVNL